MNKIVYIIPGLGENTKQQEYKKIINYFQKKHFRVIPIKINWKRRVMSDYVQDFFDQYHQHNKNDQVYLFGFSFGAMISFIVSSQIKPQAQILCSLSPYFKEDLPTIRGWWKKLMGKARINNFGLWSFNNLSKKISCKTYIMVGAKEVQELVKRVKAANKKINNSELFAVDKAKHNIAQKEYLEQIKNVINKL